MKLTWVLERNIFKDNHEGLANSLIENQIDVIDWDDKWLEQNSYPDMKDNFVVFHGSLGNANHIVKNNLWYPGAYCNTSKFECTYWYPQLKKWLVQQNWVVTTVEDLVNNPDIVKEKCFFVRPNSPLKPFSGRVLRKEDISYNSLDFGFYYENPKEKIIISSISNIHKEWRYVICKSLVVTGSSYTADNRQATDNEWKGNPLDFAKEIASTMDAPDDIYIMDICLTDNGLKLLELNPFSGADLYNCNRDHITKAVLGLFLEYKNSINKDS